MVEGWNFLTEMDDQSGNPDKHKLNSVSLSDNGRMFKFVSNKYKQ